MIKELFGALSIVCAIAAFAPYIPGILKGVFKPHVFTWVIWALTSVIIFAAQYSENAGAGMWITAFAAFMCIVITLLGLRHGEKEITRGDKIMFVSALLAIPLWQATHDPLWSVIWLTIIDIIGYYPTLRKSYLRPHQESAFLFAAGGAQFMFSLPAMETFNMTTVFYPAVVMVINYSFALLILWRRTRVCIIS